jgi:hypothetical protein
MIGFISTSVTYSVLITLKYRQYSAIAHLHTFQFTVAHALGFCVPTSRLGATDLKTETITISLDYALQILHINEVFKTHSKSSQADLLYSAVLLVPIRSASLRLSLYSLHTEHAENTASVVVEACLPRRCLATVAARTP